MENGEKMIGQAQDSGVGAEDGERPEPLSGRRGLRDGPGGVERSARTPAAKPRRKKRKRKQFKRRKPAEKTGQGQAGVETEEVDLEVRWAVTEVKVPRCPYCQSTEKQRCYGRQGNVRYYECGVCVYPGRERRTGAFTRYKAIIT